LKYSTVKLIRKWLDSKKNISSLDNNADRTLLILIDKKIWLIFLIIVSHRI